MPRFLGRRVGLGLAMFAMVVSTAGEASAQSQRKGARHQVRKPAATRAQAKPAPANNRATGGVLSSFGSTSGGSASYHGYNRSVLRDGRYIPSSAASSFFPTPEAVYGGVFMPGYGVNMGFPTPEPVYGGTYIPGYGVNMGFGSAVNVQSGTFLPGSGVNFGAPGSTSVHGGSLVPGFGVIKH